MKKIIASVIIASLVVSLVPARELRAFMADARETREVLVTLERPLLPASLGMITEAALPLPDGGDGDLPLIVCIQDLHGHPEAQRNISRILTRIDNRNGIGRIFLEGGIDRVDTSWASAFSGPAQERVLEALLSQGKLTGAEYFAIRGDRPDILQGLEDEAIYVDNLRRLSAIIGEERKCEQFVEAMRRRVATLKSVYYGRRNRRIDALFNGREERRSPHERLVRYAGEQGIDTSRYRTVHRYIALLKIRDRVRYPAVSRELGRLMESLKRTAPYGVYRELTTALSGGQGDGSFAVPLMTAAARYAPDAPRRYPDLYRYFGVLRLGGMINPVELVAEERILVRELQYRLSKSAAERDIVFLDDFIRHLKGFYSHEMSAGDYEYYERNKAAFGLLWKQYVDIRGDAAVDDRLAALLDAFFAENLRRNTVFMRHIQAGFAHAARRARAVAETDDPACIGPAVDGAREVAVVIAGGFHTRGLAELLRQNNYPYIVITPAVTRDHSSRIVRYEHLVQQQVREIALQSIPAMPASEFMERVLAGAGGSFTTDRGLVQAYGAAAVIEELLQKRRSADEAIDELAALGFRITLQRQTEAEYVFSLGSAEGNCLITIDRVTGGSKVRPGEAGPVEGNVRKPPLFSILYGPFERVQEKAERGEKLRWWETVIFCFGDPIFGAPAMETGLFHYTAWTGIKILDRLGVPGHVSAILAAVWISPVYAFAHTLVQWIHRAWPAHRTGPAVLLSRELWSGLWRANKAYLSHDAFQFVYRSAVSGLIFNLPFLVLFPHTFSALIYTTAIHSFVNRKHLQMLRKHRGDPLVRLIPLFSVFAPRSDHADADRLVTDYYAARDRLLQAIADLDYEAYESAFRTADETSRRVRELLPDPAALDAVVERLKQAGILDGRRLGDPDEVLHSGGETFTGEHRRWIRETVEMLVNAVPGFGQLPVARRERIVNDAADSVVPYSFAEGIPRPEAMRGVFKALRDDHLDVMKKVLGGAAFADFQTYAAARKQADDVAQAQEWLAHSVNASLHFRESHNYGMMDPTGKRPRIIMHALDSKAIFCYVLAHELKHYLDTLGITDNPGYLEITNHAIETVLMAGNAGDTGEGWRETEPGIEEMHRYFAAGVEREAGSPGREIGIEELEEIARGVLARNLEESGAGPEALSNALQLNDSLQRGMGVVLGGMLWTRSRAAGDAADAEAVMGRSLALALRWDDTVLAAHTQDLLRFKADPERRKRILSGIEAKRYLYADGRDARNIVFVEQSQQGRKVFARSEDADSVTIHYVPELLDNPDDEVGKALFYEQLYSALHSDLGRVEPAYRARENAFFLTLFSDLELLRTRELAARQGNAFARPFARLNEALYPNPHSMSARRRMNALPPVIQFLEALLYEGRTGEDVDPRVSDREVYRALEHTRKWRRKAVEAQDTAAAYRIIRDRIWTDDLVRALMERSQEELRERALEQEAKDRAGRTGQTSTAQSLWEEKSEAARQALQHAAMQQLIRQLQEHLGNQAPANANADAASRQARREERQEAVDGMRSQVRHAQELISEMQQQADGLSKDAGEMRESAGGMQGQAGQLRSETGRRPLRPEDIAQLKTMMEKIRQQADAVREKGRELRDSSADLNRNSGQADPGLAPSAGGVRKEARELDASSADMGKRVERLSKQVDELGRSLEQLEKLTRQQEPGTQQERSGVGDVEQGAGKVGDAAGETAEAGDGIREQLGKLREHLDAAAKELERPEQGGNEGTTEAGADTRGEPRAGQEGDDRTGEEQRPATPAPSKDELRKRKLQEYRERELERQREESGRPKAARVTDISGDIRRRELTDAEQREMHALFKDLRPKAQTLRSLITHTLNETNLSEPLRNQRNGVPDTENIAGIPFGTAMKKDDVLPGAVKHRILFILDTSGSMGSSDEGDDPMRHMVDTVLLNLIALKGIEGVKVGVMAYGNDATNMLMRFTQATDLANFNEREFYLLFKRFSGAMGSTNDIETLYAGAGIAADGVDEYTEMTVIHLCDGNPDEPRLRPRVRKLYNDMYAGVVSDKLTNPATRLIKWATWVIGRENKKEVKKYVPDAMIANRFRLTGNIPFVGYIPDSRTLLNEIPAYVAGIFKGRRTAAAWGRGVETLLAQAVSLADPVGAFVKRELARILGVDVSLVTGDAVHAAIRSAAGLAQRFLDVLFTGNNGGYLLKRREVERRYGFIAELERQTGKRIAVSRAPLNLLAQNYDRFAFATAAEAGAVIVHESVLRALLKRGPPASWQGKAPDPKAEALEYLRDQVLAHEMEEDEFLKLSAANDIAALKDRWPDITSEDTASLPDNARDAFHRLTGRKYASLFDLADTIIDEERHDITFIGYRERGGKTFLRMRIPGTSPCETEVDVRLNDPRRVRLYVKADGAWREVEPGTTITSIPEEIGFSVQSNGKPVIRPFVFNSDNLGKIKEILDVCSNPRAENSNIMLEGPRGSGKNTLGYIVAALTGQPVRVMSFHAHTNVDDLKHRYAIRVMTREMQVQLDQLAAKVQMPSHVIVRMWSEVYEAARHDELLILDEVDKAQLPGVLAALNLILNRMRETEFLQDNDGRSYIGERFRVMGFANDDEGDIHGRDIKSTARDFARRFSWIHVDYLSKANELDYVMRTVFEDVSEEDYGYFWDMMEKVIDAAHKIRADVRKPDRTLTRYFSTRGVLKVARHLKLFRKDGELYFRSVFEKAYGSDTLDAGHGKLDEIIEESGLTNTTFEQAIADGTFDVKRDLGGFEYRIEDGAVYCHLGNGDYHVRVRTGIRPDPDEVRRAQAGLKPEWHIPENMYYLWSWMKELSMGNGIMVLGVPGVWKTLGVHYLVEGVLHRPYAVQQLDTVTRGDEILGHMTQSSEPETMGETVFKKSPYALAAEQGMIAILEEIDKPREKTALSALNNLEEFGTTILEDGTVLNRHPDFIGIWIGNLHNKGGTLHSRQIGGDVLDRKSVFVMKPLSRAGVIEVLERRARKDGYAFSEGFIRRLAFVFEALGREAEAGNLPAAPDIGAMNLLMDSVGRFNDNLLRLKAELLKAFAVHRAYEDKVGEALEKEFDGKSLVETAREEWVAAAFRKHGYAATQDEIHRRAGDMAWLAGEIAGKRFPNPEFLDRSRINEKLLLLFARVLTQVARHDGALFFVDYQDAGGALTPKAVSIADLIATGLDLEPEHRERLIAKLYPELSHLGKIMPLQALSAELAGAGEIPEIDDGSFVDALTRALEGSNGKGIWNDRDGAVRTIFDLLWTLCTRDGNGTETARQALQDACEELFPDYRQRREEERLRAEQEARRAAASAGVRGLAAEIIEALEQNKSRPVGSVARAGILSTTDGYRAVTSVDGMTAALVNGKMVAIAHHGPVERYAWSEDFNYLMLFPGGALAVYEAGTGKRAQDGELSGEFAEITAMSFDPAGRAWTVSGTPASPGGAVRKTIRFLEARSLAETEPVRAVVAGDTIAMHRGDKLRGSAQNNGLGRNRTPWERVALAPSAKYLIAMDENGYLTYFNGSALPGYRGIGDADRLSSVVNKGGLACWIPGTNTAFEVSAAGWAGVFDVERRVPVRSVKFAPAKENRVVDLVARQDPVGAVVFLLLEDGTIFCCTMEKMQFREVEFLSGEYCAAVRLFITDRRFGAQTGESIGKVLERIREKTVEPDTARAAVGELMRVLAVHGMSGLAAQVAATAGIPSTDTGAFKEPEQVSLSRSPDGSHRAYFSGNSIRIADSVFTMDGDVVKIGWWNEFLVAVDAGHTALFIDAVQEMAYEQGWPFKLDGKDAEYRFMEIFTEKDYARIDYEEIRPITATRGQLIDPLTETASLPKVRVYPSPDGQAQAVETGDGKLLLRWFDTGDTMEIPYHGLFTWGADCNGFYIVNSDNNSFWRAQTREDGWAQWHFGYGRGSKITAIEFGEKKGYLTVLQENGAISYLNVNDSSIQGIGLHSDGKLHVFCSQEMKKSARAEGREVVCLKEGKITERIPYPEPVKALGWYMSGEILVVVDADDHVYLRNMVHDGSPLAAGDVWAGKLRIDGMPYDPEAGIVTIDFHNIVDDNPEPRPVVVVPVEAEPAPTEINGDTLRGIIAAVASGFFDGAAAGLPSDVAVAVRALEGVLEQGAERADALPAAFDALGRVLGTHGMTDLAAQAAALAGSVPASAGESDRTLGIRVRDIDTQEAQVTIDDVVIPLPAQVKKLGTVGKVVAAVCSDGSVHLIDDSSKALTPGDRCALNGEQGVFKSARYGADDVVRVSFVAPGRAAPPRVSHSPDGSHKAYLSGNLVRVNGFEVLRADGAVVKVGWWDEFLVAVDDRGKAYLADASTQNEVKQSDTFVRVGPSSTRYALVGIAAEDDAVRIEYQPLFPSRPIESHVVSALIETASLPEVYPAPDGKAEAEKAGDMVTVLRFDTGATMQIRCSAFTWAGDSKMCYYAVPGNNEIRYRDMENNPSLFGIIQSAYVGEGKAEITGLSYDSAKKCMHVVQKNGVTSRLEGGSWRVQSIVSGPGGPKKVFNGTGLSAAASVQGTYAVIEHDGVEPDWIDYPLGIKAMGWPLQGVLAIIDGRDQLHLWDDGKKKSVQEGDMLTSDSRVESSHYTPGDEKVLVRVCDVRGGSLYEFYAVLTEFGPAVQDEPAPAERVRAVIAGVVRAFAERAARGMPDDVARAVKALEGFLANTEDPADALQPALAALAGALRSHGKHELSGVVSGLWGGEAPRETAPLKVDQSPDGRYSVYVSGNRITRMSGKEVLRTAGDVAKIGWWNGSLVAIDDRDHAYIVNVVTRKELKPPDSFTMAGDPDIEYMVTEITVDRGRVRIAFRPTVTGGQDAADTVSNFNEVAGLPQVYPAPDGKAWAVRTSPNEVTVHWFDSGEKVSFPCCAFTWAGNSERCYYADADNRIWSRDQDSRHVDDLRQSAYVGKPAISGISYVAGEKYLHVTQENGVASLAGEDGDVRRITRTSGGVTKVFNSLNLKCSASVQDTCVVIEHDGVETDRIEYPLGIKALGWTTGGDLAVLDGGDTPHLWDYFHRRPLKEGDALTDDVWIKHIRYHAAGSIVIHFDDTRKGQPFTRDAVLTPFGPRALVPAVPADERIRAVIAEIIRAFANAGGAGLPEDVARAVRALEAFLPKAADDPAETLRAAVGALADALRAHGKHELAGRIAGAGDAAANDLRWVKIGPSSEAYGLLSPDGARVVCADDGVFTAEGGLVMHEIGGTGSYKAFEHALGMEDGIHAETIAWAKGGVPLFMVQYDKGVRMLFNPHTAAFSAGQTDSFPVPGMRIRYDYDEADRRATRTLTEGTDNELKLQYWPQEIEFESPVPVTRLVPNEDTTAPVALDTVVSVSKKGLYRLYITGNVVRVGNAEFTMDADIERVGWWNENQAVVVDAQGKATLIDAFYAGMIRPGDEFYQTDRASDCKLVSVELKSKSVWIRYSSDDSVFAKDFDGYVRKLTKVSGLPKAFPAPDGKAEAVESGADELVLRWSDGTSRSFDPAVPFAWGADSETYFIVTADNSIRSGTRLQEVSATFSQAYVTDSKITGIRYNAGGHYMEVTQENGVISLATWDGRVQAIVDETGGRKKVYSSLDLTGSAWVEGTQAVAALQTTGKEIVRVNIPKGIKAMGWLPDHTLVILDGDDAVHLSAGKDKLLHKGDMRTPDISIEEAQYDPGDGNAVITFGGARNESVSVVMTNFEPAATAGNGLAAGEVPGVIEQVIAAFGVAGMSDLPGDIMESVLALAEAAGVRAEERNHGTVVTPVPGAANQSLTVSNLYGYGLKSPDGKHALFCGSAFDKLVVRSLDTGVYELIPMITRDDLEAAAQVAWSDDGKFVLVTPMLHPCPLIINVSERTPKTIRSRDEYEDGDVSFTYLYGPDMNQVLKDAEDDGGQDDGLWPREIRFLAKVPLALLQQKLEKVVSSPSGSATAVIAELENGTVVTLKNYTWSGNDYTVNCTAFAWHPVRHVALFGDDDGRVISVARDGSETVLLASQGAPVVDMTFSDDGAWILVRRADGETVVLTGTVQNTLRTSGCNIHPYRDAVRLDTLDEHKPFDVVRTAYAEARPADQAGHWASLDSDGNLRVWYGYHETSLDRGVRNFAWSNDGKTIAIVKGGSIEFKTEEGIADPKRITIPASNIAFIGWVEGDELLAAVHENGNVSVWHTLRGNCLYPGQVIQDVTFRGAIPMTAGDQLRVVVLLEDAAGRFMEKRARMQDAGRRCLDVFVRQPKILEVGVTHAGVLHLTVEENGVRLYQGMLEGPAGVPFSLMPDHDGNVLVGTYPDGGVVTWDTASGRLLDRTSVPIRDPRILDVRREDPGAGKTSLTVRLQDTVYDPDGSCPVELSRNIDLAAPAAPLHLLRSVYRRVDDAADATASDEYEYEDEYEDEDENEDRWLPSGRGLAKALTGPEFAVGLETALLGVAMVKCGLICTRSLRAFLGTVVVTAVFAALHVFSDIDERYLDEAEYRRSANQFPISFKTFLKREFAMKRLFSRDSILKPLASRFVRRFIPGHLLTLPFLIDAFFGTLISWSIHRHLLNAQPGSSVLGRLRECCFSMPAAALGRVLRAVMERFAVERTPVLGVAPGLNGKTVVFVAGVSETSRERADALAESGVTAVVIAAKASFADEGGVPVFLPNDCRYALCGDALLDVYASEQDGLTVLRYRAAGTESVPDDRARAAVLEHLRSNPRFAALLGLASAGPDIVLVDEGVAVAPLSGGAVREPFDATVYARVQDASVPDGWESAGANARYDLFIPSEMPLPGLLRLLEDGVRARTAASVSRGAALLSVTIPVGERKLDDLRFWETELHGYRELMADTFVLSDIPGLRDPAVRRDAIAAIGRVAAVAHREEGRLVVEYDLTDAPARTGAEGTARSLLRCGADGIRLRVTGTVNAATLETIRAVAGAADAETAGREALVAVALPAAYRADEEVRAALESWNVKLVVEYASARELADMRLSPHDWPEWTPGTHLKTTVDAFEREVEQLLSLHVHLAGISSDGIRQGMLALLDGGDREPGGWFARLLGNRVRTLLLDPVRRYELARNAALAEPLSGMPGEALQALFTGLSRIDRAADLAAAAQAAGMAPGTPAGLRHRVAAFLNPAAGDEELARIELEGYVHGLLERDAAARATEQHPRWGGNAEDRPYVEMFGWTLIERQRLAHAGPARAAGTPGREFDALLKEAAGWDAATARFGREDLARLINRLYHAAHRTGGDTPPYVLTALENLLRLYLDTPRFNLKEELRGLEALPAAVKAILGSS